MDAASLGDLIEDELRCLGVTGGDADSADADDAFEKGLFEFHVGDAEEFDGVELLGEDSDFGVDPGGADETAGVLGIEIKKPTEEGHEDEGGGDAKRSVGLKRFKIDEDERDKEENDDADEIFPEVVPLGDGEGEDWRIVGGGGGAGGCRARGGGGVGD